VIMLVDRNRANAQNVLKDLELQTCADHALEIIIHDASDLTVPPLIVKSRFALQYLRRPGIHYWRVARAIATRGACGSIIAFLEDHCRPHPDWAEELMKAHAEGVWAAVGYAFTNGSPDSWWSRSLLMADYGLFADPVPGGPATILAGNNVSYARWFLDELGEAFEKETGVDFNIQQIAIARGYKMKIAPKVRAAHSCYPRLSTLCAANYFYVKILAVARARVGAWSYPKRLIWAAGVLALVPALRLFRLGCSIWSRPSLRMDFIAAIPVLIAVYHAAALGEASGYLRGIQNAEEKFLECELNMPRIE